MFWKNKKESLENNLDSKKENAKITYGEFLKGIEFADIIEMYDEKLEERFLFLVLKTWHCAFISFKKNADICICEDFLCIDKNHFVEKRKILNYLKPEYCFPYKYEYNYVIFDKGCVLVHDKYESYNFLIQCDKNTIKEIDDNMDYKPKDYKGNCLIKINNIVYPAAYRKECGFYIYKLSDKTYLSKGKVKNVIYLGQQDINIRSMDNKKFNLENNQITYPYPYEHGKKIFFAIEKFKSKVIGGGWEDYIKGVLKITYESIELNNSNGTAILLNCTIDVRFIERLKHSEYVILL